MGVEAIGERGHFYLEGSKSPQLQPAILSPMTAVSMPRSNRERVYIGAIYFPAIFD